MKSEQINTNPNQKPNNKGANIKKKFYLKYFICITFVIQS